MILERCTTEADASYAESTKLEIRLQYKYRNYYVHHRDSNRTGVPKDRLTRQELFLSHSVMRKFCIKVEAEPFNVSDFPLYVSYADTKLYTRAKFTDWNFENCLVNNITHKIRSIATSRNLDVIWNICPYVISICI